MKEYESVSHTSWDCKCHVAYLKEAQKAIFKMFRKQLGNNIVPDDIEILI